MKPRTLLPTLVASVMVCPAGAAVVNFTIHLGDSVPADLGLTSGMTFNGTASYNDSLVPTVGGTTLTPVTDGSLTITFMLAGTVFDQDHDTDPDFPALYFSNGILTGMNYFADNHHPASGGAGYVQIETNITGTSFNYSFDGFSDYAGEVTWDSTPAPTTPVPEPSTALLAGLATLVSFRRYIRR